MFIDAWIFFLNVDGGCGDITPIAEGTRFHLRSAQQILSALSFVPWEVQEAIASEIRSRLPEIQPLLGWTQPPTGSQLETACDLIFRFLNKRALQEYRINSGAQLAWHLNGLRMGNDLSAYVKTCVARRCCHRCVGSQSIACRTSPCAC